MKKIKSFGYSLAVVSILGLSLLGCGGSGGSSSSSGLSFPSNAVSAVPTLENGEKVEEVVTQNQQDIYSISSVSSSSSQNLALTMKQINEVFMSKVDTDFYSLNSTINETISCSGGGSVNYSGSGDETNGATVTATFNSCVESDMTIDGKMQVVLSNYNTTYDDYATISTSFLTTFSLNVSGLSMKVLQGSTTKIEMSNFTGYDTADNMKITISAISEVNGIKTGQQGSVYHFDLSDYYNISMYQTAGKIYIDNLTSYVEYDTSYDMSLTPFVFNYDDLVSGEARYIMSNGANLKIVVENNEPVVYIDADNDGTYELAEI